MAQEGMRKSKKVRRSCHDPDFLGQSEALTPLTMVAEPKHEIFIVFLMCVVACEENVIARVHIYIRVC